METASVPCIDVLCAVIYDGFTPLICPGLSSLRLLLPGQNVAEMLTEEC